MQDKLLIKHNVLQYLLKGEKMYKEKADGIMKVAEYEMDRGKLAKLLKWERNNINKAIRAHNEILKLRAEGIR